MELEGTDWVGVQIGMKRGNDKTQFIFHGRNIFYNFSDSDLSNEGWNQTTWRKFTIDDLVNLINAAKSETAPTTAQEDTIQGI